MSTIRFQSIGWWVVASILISVTTQLATADPGDLLVWEWHGSDGDPGFVSSNLSGDPNTRYDANNHVLRVAFGERPGVTPQADVETTYGINLSSIDPNIQWADFDAVFEFKVVDVGYNISLEIGDGMSPVLNTLSDNSLIRNRLYNGGAGVNNYIEVFSSSNGRLWYGDFAPGHPQQNTRYRSTLKRSGLATSGDAILEIVTDRWDSDLSNWILVDSFGPVTEPALNAPFSCIRFGQITHGNYGEIWVDHIRVASLQVTPADPCPGTFDLFVDGVYGNDKDWDGRAAQWDGAHGPKKTIQSAITAAQTGDTVAVANGTYSGTGNVDLDFLGKAITVRSACDDPNNCVIDCQGNSRGFVFDENESETSVVRGFTIKNGYASIGGGIYCTNHSSPTITNCRLIHGYTSPEAYAGGAGIGCVNGASPIIRDCVISHNQSRWYGGGGVWARQNARPVLERCVIEDNEGYIGGGVLAVNNSKVTLLQCVVRGNRAIDYGGGVAIVSESDAKLDNCLISRNVALTNFGGGIATDQGSACTLRFCTVVSNAANGRGGGLDLGDPNAPLESQIENSIIWGNAPTAMVSNFAVPMTNCVIEGAIPDRALGIDPNHPMLTPSGHLTEYSDACFDKAGSTSLQFDIDGEPRIFDGIADIGADEFIDVAPTPNGLPDWWELRYFTQTNVDPNADPDEDDFITRDEYEIYDSNPSGGKWYVNAALGNDLWNGADPNEQVDDVGPKRTLQGVIDAANSGDTIYVAPGTYTGAGNYEINLHQKALLFIGGPGVVLDAGGAGRILDPATLSSGLTLFDGFTWRGAPVVDTVTLRTPLGGGGVNPILIRSFLTGTTLNISWVTSGNINDVKLDLLHQNVFGDPRKATIVRNSVTPSTSNTSMYDWLIPDAVSENSDFFMRISDVANPDTYSVSGELAFGHPSSESVAASLSSSSEDVSLTSDTANFTSYFGAPDFRWPLRVNRGHVVLQNCTFDSDGLSTMLGGFGVNQANVTLNQVTLRDSSGTDSWIDSSHVTVSGPVWIEDPNLVIESSIIDGDGSLTLSPNTTLHIVGPYHRQTRCSVNLIGTGNIIIDQDAELRLIDEAILDLSGQPGAGCADPGTSDTWGKVTIDGALIVDNATVKNTNIDVRLADFDGGKIENNNIRLLASAGFGGEFFVENAAEVLCNHIVSEGDRYLDLDPDPSIDPNDRPVIENNTIDVIITQGVGSERGELLELRAGDYDCGDPNGPNPGCASGAFQVTDSSGFTADPSENWVLESLTIKADAKVNLTNRQGFDFGIDPNYPETAYVKELILEPNAVLNTAQQTLYYQALVGMFPDPNYPNDPNRYLEIALTRDPNDPAAPMVNGSRIVDVPLLGFSLKVIDMENDEEFRVRVRRRLNDPNDTDPTQTGAISRISASRLGDPNNAAMRMQTEVVGLRGALPATSVTAKGAFARAGEDEIIVAFDYRFISLEQSGDEPAEIRVYLSAEPEVRAPDRRRIATIYPPLQPWFTESSASEESRFAEFYGVFDCSDFNFKRGTYVELELRGIGAIVEIDNWDPAVECPTGECGNFETVSQDSAGDVADYLYLIGELGNPITEGKQCLDWLSKDKFVDLEDVLIYDAYIYDADSLGHYCDMAPVQSAQLASSVVSLTQGGNAPNLPPACLVIAGKPGGLNQDGFSNQVDRLYPLDPNGNILGDPREPASRPDAQWVEHRGNGRLIKDLNGEIYQLHVVQGLIRLSDAVTVLRPNVDTFGQSTVSIGLNGSGGSSSGIAIQDAAFDPRDPNILYVVPVLVEPGSGASYEAAARIRLNPDGSPTIESLIGPDPNSSENNCDPSECSVVNLQHLREIEVDAAGNVFISSAFNANDNSWILVYTDAGNELLHRQLYRDDDHDELIAPSPTAMKLSMSGEYLYFASNVTRFADTDTTLYRLRVERAVDQRVKSLNYTHSQDAMMIAGMRGVMDINEHPCSGELWVLGINDPNGTTWDDWENKKFNPFEEIFFEPALARISEWGTPVSADIPKAADLAMPISAAFLGTPIITGDLDCDELVSTQDALELFERINGAEIKDPPAGITRFEFLRADLDGDGDVDLGDVWMIQERVN